MEKHVTKLANTGSAKKTHCLDSLHDVSLAVASGVRPHMKIIYIVILFVVTSCSVTKKDMFLATDELDEFDREWYSEHLRAAREDRLSLPTEGNIYRFTWLRSFHAPVIIKVSCYEECKLRARVLSGLGGYEPGKIVKSVNKTISVEERGKLEEYFQKLNFWDGQPDSGIVMLDGAVWILEAAKDNDYRVWNVAGPHYEKQFLSYIEFCVYMLELAGIEIPKDEFY